MRPVLERHSFGRQFRANTVGIRETALLAGKRACRNTLLNLLFVLRLQIAYPKHPIRRVLIQKPKQAGSLM